MRFAVLILLAAVAAGCSPNVCGPTNCPGCCGSDGACQGGSALTACGTGGNACDICEGAQVCGDRCITPDAGVPDAGPGLRCDATPTLCSDQAIQGLDLKNTVSSANTTVTSSTDGGSFDSTVDATAGGVTPTKSFVYAKFTDVGLIGVAVDDQSSLDSLDWDIAFRRFVIRINSGNSGPSCVGAFAYPKSTTFDAAALPAAGATYATDDTFTAPPACMLIPDGSGLSTSPSTALDNPTASFYTYVSCVKMSGQVFAVQTREGRIVKVEITGYYATDAAQQQCQGGTMPNVAGGHISLHWAFLQ